MAVGTVHPGDSIIRRSSRGDTWVSRPRSEYASVNRALIEQAMKRGRQREPIRDVVLALERHRSM